MPSKAFSPNLTSYDLLKSFALLLMIIDHVGYYFYPENEWFRVIGRASMPIWMFLVGYANSRDLSKPLWIGAGLLIAANFVFGGSIFPLSILVTIILIRLVIDRVSWITFKNWEMTLYGTFVLSALILVTYIFSEYGTAALLIAMAGYVARHSQSLNLTPRVQKVFMGYAIVFYALSQLIIFDFEQMGARIMVMGIGAVAILLYYFQPKEVPEVEDKLPRAATLALQIGGRYTLEIYVAHLILFKLIACVYGLQHHGWFQFAMIR